MPSEDMDYSAHHLSQVNRNNTLKSVAVNSVFKALNFTLRFKQKFLVRSNF